MVLHDKSTLIFLSLKLSNFYISRFLGFGTTDILDSVVRSCHMQYRVFNIPGLYPLDSGSFSLSVMTIKNVYRC